MDALSTLLLRRAGRVHLPAGNEPVDGFVDHLEIDLAERGWLLDPIAREAFATMQPTQRTAWADWLLASVEAEAGTDRPLVPLFRKFPDTTPGDTDGLFVARILSFLIQEPGQPCVLCGSAGSVAPVSPCAHLVCRSCFDGSDYSACPICQRRIDPDDPFLVVVEPGIKPTPGAPLRLRVAAGRPDKMADARELRDGLIGRLAPLSESDREDLALLISATTHPGDLSWLPDVVPARETLAFVLALAIRNTAPTDIASVVGPVSMRWTTVTDIARMVWVLAGGSPGLVLPARPTAGPEPSDTWRPASEPPVKVQAPRVPPIPRPLRRAVLATFERLDPANAIEDVLRHPTVWKRIAERLHPFEHARVFPVAAVCFAVLRGSTHAIDSSVGRALLKAADQGLIDIKVVDGQVRAIPRTFGARVESALASGDTDEALRLLRGRPGELLRRLDHLARLTPPEGLDPLVTAVLNAGGRASARVALSAFAALHDRDQTTVAEAALRRSRAAAGASASAALGSTRARRGLHKNQPAQDERDPSVPRRVFFPRGNLMRAKSFPDRRPLLPAGGPERLRSALVLSLLGRSQALERFEVAVIDAALTGYPLPGRTQAAAGANTEIPRGTEVALPEGETVRLFLHWVQPERHRVDLDLSAVLFDDDWRYLGHCDYTDLRPRAGAVHSGDLQSAPGPEGATEFIDLEVSTLAAGGVAHIGVVVFSFNDVPFAEMDDAYAGFSSPTPRGALLDPARVAIRFDLQGDSRVTVPMTFHLAERTARWLDLHLGSKGFGHSVHSHGEAVARAGADMELAYGGGRRPTLFDLAAIHAVGRAGETWVRHDDGTFSRLSGLGVDGFAEARDVATKPSTGAAAPEMEDRSVLLVATDRLPDDAGTAGRGSILISVSGREPLANSSVTDLIDSL